MPIDEAEYDKPARQGDVAGVAIHMVTVARTLEVALTKIKMGKTADLDAQIDTLSDSAAKLDKMFERLVGWTKA